MKNIQTKKSDLSLLFMAFVMAAILLLLSGCNNPNADSAAMPGTEATHGAVMDEEESTPSEIALEVIEVAEPVEVAVAANTPSYETGVMQSYSQEKFDAAVENGDPVLLDFYAAWCGTCRGNAPKVEAALEASDVVGLRIDYDTAQDLRVKHSVVSQSTLIVFKNGEETKRAMGPQSDKTLLELLQ